MNLESHLIALERLLHDPAVRGDSEAVAGLLSTEFFEFGASGRVWSREMILEELAREPGGAILSGEFVCKELAAEVVLLTYVSETPTRRVLRSSLWRLEGESWRMVFHQGTPIA
jgi:hypothetical protein